MKFHNFTLLLPLALASCSSPDLQTQPQPGLTFPSIPEVDAVIQQVMEDQELTGLGVGIIQDDRIVHLKTYGLADLATEEALQPSHYIRWSSISKSLTAIAAMKQLERGNLTLDGTTVDEFYPQYPRFRGITMRQLLNHTSGLFHWTEMPEPDEEIGIPHNEPWNADLVVRAVSEFPVFSEPGDACRYSSPGYIVAGAVLEKIGLANSGGSFLEQVYEGIKEPLSLTSLQPNYGFLNIPKKAKLYIREENTISEIVHHAAFNLPAGDFGGNLMDLTVYMHALLNGNLLSSESWDALWTRQSRNNGTEIDYGLGFALEATGATFRVSHGGSGAGNKAQLSIFPKMKSGIVLLSNCSWLERGGVVRSLIQALNRNAASFSDTFADASRGWAVSSSPHRSYEYGAHWYSITSHVPGTWNSTQRVPLDPRRNFRVEALVKLLNEQPKSYAAGLVLGRRDADNYAFFAVNDQDQYGLFLKQRGQTLPIIDWKPSAVLEGIRAFNPRIHLALQKNGPYLHLFINHEWQDSTETVLPFAGDFHGFYLKSEDADVSMLYDDFQVTDLQTSNSKGVLLDETFHDNRRDWGIRDNDAFYYNIAHDAYTVGTHNQGNAHASIFIPVNYDADYLISAKARKSSREAANSVGFGLIYGRESSLNYFNFLVNGAGFYTIARMHDGRYERLAGWSRIPHVEPWPRGNQPYHLAIQRMGPVTHFFINDVPVHAIRDHPEFAHNRHGFNVWSGANRLRITFDDLRVMQLRGQNF